MQDELERNRQLRERYDHRSSLQKKFDFIKSFFKQVKYIFSVLLYRIVYRPHKKKIAWKERSDGLMVFLHGLFYDPSVWYAQLALLKNSPEIDIFAPVIPKRGVCSLEEAAEPLLIPILQYVKKHPKAPICLAGISNGGRIAMWIETQLRPLAPEVPVFVSTIAGIHFGSTTVNLVDDWGIAQTICPKALTEELRYASPKARALLEKIKKTLPPGCAPRGYEFYASTEDLSIPELGSALPALGKGEKYYVLHGESHESIVRAVAKHQVASCLHWIRSNALKS